MRKVYRVQKIKKEIPFSGGLDVTTPPRYVRRGYCRNARNMYEDLEMGYVTTLRYEKYDGQISPSDARYAIIRCSQIVDVKAGDTLTDDAEAVSGHVIAVSAEYIAVTKVTGGSFPIGNLKVSSVVQAISTSKEIFEGAPTSKLDSLYKSYAADVYREDISAVPGSGPIRGVFRFSDTTFAFRNNAGGTATELYESSAFGFIKVELGFELSFTSGGTFVPLEGHVLTDPSSGATGTITRVVVQSGDFDTGDAAGKFIFLTTSGTFDAGPVDIGANSDVATIAGDAQAIILQPGGKYDIVIANFTGAEETRRVYGCDGVNKGFEFDGSVFVPIETGMVDDTPDHVFSHKNHLIFTFGASFQHSSPGFPYVWDVIVGAGELAVGDRITGLSTLPGDQTTGALAVWARNSFNILYGNNISDWNLVAYKSGIGAIEWSPQEIERVFIFDDTGIVNIQAAQKFGNFRDGSSSDLVKKWINQYTGSVTHSCALRNKNLYCLFFEDKTAAYCTVRSGKIVSIMPQLLSHKVERIFTTEDSDGSAVTFFGDDDGFIYQLDKGTSFDGENVSWFGDLSYDHFGSPMTKKKFLRAMIEMVGEGYSEFSFGYSLGGGSPLISQPTSIDYETGYGVGSPRWDHVYWDHFYWDSIAILPKILKLYGKANNISFHLAGDSASDSPVNFSGINLKYIPTKDLK